MSSNARTAITAAAMLCMLAGTAAADKSDWNCWTWGKRPIGSTAEVSSRYERMVKVVTYDNLLGGFRTGEEMADDLAAQLYNENVSRLCVVLLGFGLGNQPFIDTDPPHFTETWHEWGVRLWFHEGDALTGDPMDLATAGIEWPQCTLWFDNGIAEAGAVMDDLIDRYKNYWQPISSTVYPAPMRFHFDNEPNVMRGEQERFDIFEWKMEEEPYKFLTTAIPVHGDESLGNLWNNAPSIVTSTFDDDLAWNHADNQPFMRWLGSIVGEARDGATEAAAYSKIRTAWPACESSDYEATLRIDGGGGVDGMGVPHRVLLPRNANDWRYTSLHGFGDRQAPVFYPITRDYVDGEWSCAKQDAATLKHHRRTLDACVRSVFEGESFVPITPWITVPCYAISDSPGAIADYSYSESAMRHLIAMGRAKLVTEWIAWTGDNPMATAYSGAPASAWSALDEIMNGVYAADISDITVTFGTPAVAPSTELDYSNADAIEVETSAQGVVHVAAVEVEFETEFNSPNTADALEINVEAWYSDCGECTQFTGATIVSVYAWNHDTLALDFIDSFPLIGLNGTYPTIYMSTVADATDYVDTNGDVLVEVIAVAEEAQTIHFDLVQVVKVEADGCTCCSTDEEECE